MATDGTIVRNRSSFDIFPSVVFSKKHRQLQKTKTFPTGGEKAAYPVGKGLGRGVGDLEGEVLSLSFPYFFLKRRKSERLVRL